MDLALFVDRKGFLHFSLSLIEILKRTSGLNMHKTIQLFGFSKIVKTWFGRPRTQEPVF
jgi:hypothetical protein